MSGRRVVVVDYGMGNIWSVLSALRFLGSKPELSGDPDAVGEADAIVLPGVGSFRKAMEALRGKGLDQAILNAVRTKGSLILGICLGMQLLGSRGTEDGDTPGLGLVPNPVDKFKPEELGRNKIPHVGFNTVCFPDRSGLFRDLPGEADFYFVHSYRMLPDGLAGQLAISRYGCDFLAAFQIGNICGTQFHPEKSQTNGLILLRNFLELSKSC